MHYQNIKYFALFSIMSSHLWHKIVFYSECRENYTLSIYLQPLQDAWLEAGQGDEGE
jgi:hypothetical protein